MPLSRFCIIFFASVAILYLIGCALLFTTQRSLIYYPQPSFIKTAVNTLKMPVAGAELQISVRPHHGRNALIYFGGNAEDVSLSLAMFSAVFPDYAIYLLHYRGYGDSSGTPSEDAIQEDAISLFDRVYPEHQHIVIIGRSLGSGVAIRLASLRPASKLVLITPYNSIEELGEFYFPYIPISWLLLDKYLSWKYAPQITAPTLIFASAHDEVIPYSHTQRLYSHFKSGVASCKVLANTGHNTISQSSQYFLRLKEFIEEPTL